MKLDISHVNNIYKLFLNNNPYRYTPVIPWVDTNSKNSYISAEHEIFSENYLGQLSRWKSFSNAEYSAGVVYYESVDEPAWYITDIYGEDNIHLIINECIDYNHSIGLNKFYVALPIDKLKLDGLNTAYDYIDEYRVESKHKCVYSNYWQLLYKRILPEKETIVRCYFLKKEHRNI